jgi:hypothetical protein
MNTEKATAIRYTHIAHKVQLANYAISQIEHNQFKNLPVDYSITFLWRLEDHLRDPEKQTAITEQIIQDLNLIKPDIEQAVEVLQKIKFEQELPEDYLYAKSILEDIENYCRAKAS